MLSVRIPHGDQTYWLSLKKILCRALGAGYNVVNEGGDTQGTVLTGTSYCKIGIGGADWYWNDKPYNACAFNAGVNCPYGCYKDSITSPDIVVIGPWGEHDHRVVTACPTQGTQAIFQAAYDGLVMSYLALQPKPQVYVATPIVVPTFDAATQTYVTMVILPAVKAVAAKYNLPLIDLYTAFLPTDANGMYFKGPIGNGQTNAAGEVKIKDMVLAAIMGANADAGTPMDASATSGTTAGSGAASGAAGVSGASSGATVTTSGTASGSLGASGSTSGSVVATSGSAPVSGATNGDMTASGSAGASGTAGPSSGVTSNGAGNSSGSNSVGPPANSTGCSLSAGGQGHGGRWDALLSLLGLAALGRRRRA